MRRLLVLLVLAGCARKAAPKGDDDYASLDAPTEDWSGGTSSRNMVGTMERQAPGPTPDASTTTDTATAPAVARMVHYQGFAALRVGKTREAAEQVIALATAAGGSLEQQYGDTVVVRVPVARFQEVYSAVLKVGEVTRKSISAEDVTDAFTAVELRLKTAAARRDRLVQLLALSKDENEKLTLVREIQEVVEEIDRLEQQVRTLKGLASYSRITVELKERPALTWRGHAPESEAFAWIRALSPFSPELSGKVLTLATPDGFVALDVKKRFVAESAEGTRLWTDRLPNDPEGDTAFWAEALSRRLGAEFASAHPKNVGAWHGFRLLDRSDSPYVWVVLVRAAGKDLDVVEIFYPSVDAEKRHAPAVEAVLAGGEA